MFGLCDRLAGPWLVNTVRERDSKKAVYEKEIVREVIIPVMFAKHVGWRRGVTARARRGVGTITGQHSERDIERKSVCEKERGYYTCSADYVGLRGWVGILTGHHMKGRI